MSKASDLAGVAVAGAVVAGAVHEKKKTGKWPLAGKWLVGSFVAAISMPALGALLGAKPGHDSTGASNALMGSAAPFSFLGIAFAILAFICLIWLVCHVIDQAMKPLHPSNFPQFENRPVPELAREIIQTAGKPNMTERYIMLHHDPATRQVIMVPGHPDRIQCQADGFWYDWDQHQGAYVFSEV